MSRTVPPGAEPPDDEKLADFSVLPAGHRVDGMQLVLVRYMSRGWRGVDTRRSTSLCKLTG